ncbi:MULTISPECIES: LacI family DNA-binding transcriptional regulator [Micromonospora]|uniref:LacI family DNA-binding transcriptional regulator n=1 Tax=Micromonospora solifontis TaxID=2487138 RepID=A0ABX9WIC2_9ACTN|nr:MULTISPECIES: LacI family DNA-binding transcriptional regulator [Micromonospora]NES15964.1 substrate-binding domain-containing protein [Micromonospora sp. PPF5-17B]NES36615.1 substrate-binding domain-containing protein [Micromonospora solifontis]NES57365.1 substrate-binding domain-containing protein [Micromonospora sp. PPF5-6]RNL99353.1 LacI family DNA-binding transcriptional regulator [Micromonospora solifontis]
MKPTLQDVADAVGVSRSTASNAYSRPDQLSAALRAKILDAARRLGYPGPNPTARSLRRGFVGAIGVLFTSELSYAFTDPFAVRFLAGVSRTAERHGTSLLLMPLPADRARVRSVVENASVDGFCVYCVGDEEWVLQAIRDRGQPYVTTAPRADAGPDDRYVGIDERAAARSVADHVAALGHRRVALLADTVLPGAPPGPLRLAGPGDAPHPTTRGRLTGFADAFAAVGVAWPALTLLNATANSRAAGAAAVAEVLAGDEPPTAVLACSDVLSLGVLDMLAAAGHRPPHPISVTGFDDIAEAAAAGLTTVRQPAEEKGRLAAELLLEPPTTPADGHRLLPTDLVVRTSTGPVPGS